MDTNLQNFSGGVGEAYPGSTGGEIFNCYQGSGRNQASGNYSTTIGIANKNDGKYTFVGGSTNDVWNSSSSNFCFGGNNILKYGGKTLGNSNQASGIVVGNNNTNGYTANVDGYMFGLGLKYKNKEGVNTTPYGQIVIGRYNTSTKIDDPKLIIGCGASSSSNDLANAIEMNTTTCKIRHNLQLNTDTTEVNAIDPPTDPNSPTTNEQTLATLGSLDDFKALLNSMHLQRRELLLTGQLTQLTTGTAYPLESTFNISIPSWARRIRIGYQIATFGSTQNFIEFGTVSGTFSAFSLNKETGTLFGVNLSYDDTTKAITVNKVMSLTSSDDDWTVNTNTFGLISITAYGNAVF